MGTVNMAVDFGGVKMQNPINTAAGTFGYGWQFQNFFDVSQLGAITTKGCAAEPWPGNPAPRMAEIPGGMINSVGLQNPGVAAFARESGPWLEQLSKDGCQVICQVAGHSVDEFVRALVVCRAMPLGCRLRDQRELPQHRRRRCRHGLHARGRLFRHGRLPQGD